MNKKEMQKKIEDQARHIASLQRAKTAAEQKNDTLEAQLTAASDWINALAARIGTEIEMDFEELMNSPKYVCKYDAENKKITMRRKEPYEGE